jgi:DNA-binding NarL/FixJ family response regulator
MNVLIADDSVMICRRLTTLLEKIEGVTVVGHAHNVSQAIAAVNRLKPDVVVLDIKMPGGSGMNVLEKIKNEMPDSIVIILTNFNYPQYQKKYLKAGADFFFDKSTEFQKVFGVFERLGESIPQN